MGSKNRNSNNKQVILNAIRKMVPIKYRQSLGLWTASQAVRSKPLMYLYFLGLCGEVPKGVTLLNSRECLIEYKDRKILSPRDGIFTSWEVLQDEIYEKVYRPLPGDVVIDIGAYVGMFTVKAALQVGVTGKVVAIEPSSDNLLYLRKNTTGLINTKVVPYAVGSFRCRRYLTVSDASPCHSLLSKPGASTEGVTVDTLDDILVTAGVNKVDFIKIDAEGSEMEILWGARDTLKNNKVRLAIASYHNLPDGEYELPIVRDFLTEMGFRVTTIKEYVYADNLEAT